MEETPHSAEENTSSKRAKTRFWNTDKFLSLVAFLISLGTFVTFGYQTYLIQKQQYASVLPYINILHNHGSDYYTLNILNQGIGPAFIKSVKVIYQGKEHDGDPTYFKNQVIDPLYSTKTGAATLEKGTVIPAGEGLTLLESQNKEAADILKQYFIGDSVSRAEIEIVYSSVYDETWMIRSGSPIPVKLDD